MIVVVTGASSGIGRAAAIAWGKRGAKLVLSARGESALEAVAREVKEAGGEAVVEAGDVTDEGHCARLVEAARALGGGGIDVLVNNAGRGYYAAVRDVDPRELEALFALNVVAPLRLTQLALPALEQSAATAGHATIVMVSSIAGVVAAPRMGAYAASKFALEALAIALRAECAASGVRVVVVRPGPVDTLLRAHSIAKGGTPECARRGRRCRRRRRSRARSWRRSSGTGRWSRRPGSSARPRRSPESRPACTGGSRRGWSCESLRDEGMTGRPGRGATCGFALPPPAHGLRAPRDARTR